MVSKARTLLARRRSGFTLIELLLVVAIIGIIASILIPNLLDSLHRAKQKRTVSDMRETGQAWLSWLTDNISAGAAGQSQTFDLDGSFEVLYTVGELSEVLLPNNGIHYANNVPEHDGWGYPYQYHTNSDILGARVIGIQSLGRDGDPGPTGDPYPVGPFTQSNYAEDIIWVDGLFIRYPAGVEMQD